MRANTTNKKLVINEITTSEKAYEILKPLALSPSEELWVLALGPKKTLLKRKMIFRGTVDTCLVHPRDIFKFACAQNASSILIAHNHPSGELSPSYEDLRFTQQIVDASLLMEIPVIDHLIVTSKDYTSLRSEGWCQFTREDLFSARGLGEAASGYSPNSSGG